MSHNKKTAKTKDKLSKAMGINLEIGIDRRIAGSVTIANNSNADIKHDINIYPWPLPDNSCNLVIANHIIEHIPKHGISPQLSELIDLLILKRYITKKEVRKYLGNVNSDSCLLNFMNEIWRITKVDGQVALSFPYAGSVGFFQDPTHVSQLTEATFFYFDPEHQSHLWDVYKPLPWKIEVSSYQVNGNMEIVLSKKEQV